jgi:hypothetical protein
MNKMKIKMSRMKSVMAGIFIFLLPFIVSGQMFFFQDLPVDKTKLGFRYLRPDFKDVEGLSILSGVYDFSVSIPVSPKLNIVGSVPFAAIGADDTETESSIGNIYVGLQHRLNSGAEKFFSASLGVFLPTAPEDKPGPMFMGIFTNYYELQKYFPNVLTISGNVAYHRIKSNDFIFGVELGPNIFIPTKDDGETEVYIHYGLTAGYRFNTVDLKAELVGIGIITEDVDEFGDRFINDLAFGVHWNRGAFRPGVFYKISLKKDIRDFVRGAFGIKLDVIL